jgi:hypothetical protein
VSYLGVAWVLLQVANQIEETLELPAWLDQAVLVLLALGLPIDLPTCPPGSIQPDCEDRSRGDRSRQCPGRYRCREELRDRALRPGGERVDRNPWKYRVDDLEEYRSWQSNGNLRWQWISHFEQHSQREYGWGNPGRHRGQVIGNAVFANGGDRIHAGPCALVQSNRVLSNDFANNGFGLDGDASTTMGYRENAFNENRINVNGGADLGANISTPFGG